jgi:acyl-CoA thioesterase I
VFFTTVALASALAFAAEPPKEETPKAVTVVALGDSLTDGYGLDQTEAYPALLENELREKFPSLRVINGGISGSTSSGAEARLKWFLKSKPQILILCLGANDGLRGVPISTTKKNLKDTIRLAQKNKMTVLLAGMKLPPNYGETFPVEFEKVYKELAKEFKTEFFPFLLDGVAGKEDLNQPDGIHPNEKGQRLIAKNLKPVLAPLIERYLK